MKAKHWIAVGVIAVVCVGAVVLFSNKAPTEGVPVSSSVPAASEEPTATEEPAASEEPAATEEPAQTGENAVKPEDIKAEETAPAVTEPEVELTRDEEEQHAFELSVKGYEAEGMSHEEAVAEATRRLEQRKQKNAEAAAKREEYFSQRKEKEEAEYQAQGKEFERQAGITREQYDAMDIDSQIQFRRDHPDVDWSLL